MKQTIKLLLYYFLYQLGCMFVVSAFFYGGYALRNYLETGEMIIPDNNAAFALPATIIALLLSNVLVGGHLLYYKYLDRDTRTTWSPVSGKVLAAVVPLTVGMMFWMNYLMELLDLPDLTAGMFLQMKDSVFGVISIALVAPVVEEMLFRGAIEGYLLRRWKKPKWAIGVSALIFGAIHLNPAQIPYAFVLGLLLGWLYYRTGSIVPGIVLHLVNNGISVVLMLVLPDPTAGLADWFGETGAALGAVVGLVVTAGGIGYIQNKLSRA